MDSLKETKFYDINLKKIIAQMGYSVVLQLRHPPD